MRRESAARGSGCMKEMLGAVTTVSAGHGLSSTFQSILIETAGRTDRGGDHHRESSRCNAALSLNGAGWLLSTSNQRKGMRRARLAGKHDGGRLEALSRNGITVAAMPANNGIVPCFRVCGKWRTFIGGLPVGLECYWRSVEDSDRRLWRRFQSRGSAAWR
jgi:hypothetical protein